MMLPSSVTQNRVPIVTAVARGCWARVPRRTKVSYRAMVPLYGVGTNTEITSPLESKTTSGRTVSPGSKPTKTKLPTPSDINVGGSVPVTIGTHEISGSPTGVDRIDQYPFSPPPEIGMNCV